MSSKKRSGSLGREEWADAALEALSEGGLGNIAVERLATALGVTKGSFYHHFSSRSALIEAALDRWEQVATADIIEAFSAPGEPQERLERLFWSTFEAKRSAEPVGLLLSHLAAAADDPLVGPVLERVTAKRLTFLTRMFEESGMPADEARNRAMHGYSVYVGLIQVRASAPNEAPTGETLRGYVRHLVETLLP